MPLLTAPRPRVARPQLRRARVASLDTPLGWMRAAAHDGGVVLLDYADRASLDQSVARLRERFELCDAAPADHPLLARLAGELGEYFAGRRTTFTVPVDPTGTDFERRAWAALRRIPFGQTWSYGRQAASLGSPAAVRAVGRANGRNAINILVPCHRVIAAGGALTGYGGGVDRKRWLLDHEATAAGQLLPHV